MIAGCCDDPGPADGAMAMLEMGSGGLDVFEPVAEGSTVLLEPGGQGLQHVWLGLRVSNIDAQPGLIEGSLVRLSDGHIVSLPLRVRLRFIQERTYEELTGLRLVVPVADDIIGQEATLHARVTDPTGRTAEGERTVRVAWADVPLPGGDGGDSGMPDMQTPDAPTPDASATDAPSDTGDL